MCVQRLPLRGEAGLRSGPGPQARHWQGADTPLASSGWRVADKVRSRTAERGQVGSGVQAGACQAAGILLLSIAQVVSARLRAGKEFRKSGSNIDLLK